MSPYLPIELPGPMPDLNDAPLWAAFGKQQLLLQCCADCGRFRHPPVPGCPHCGSARCEWKAPAGPARLFTYTLTHVAPHPSLKDRVPFVVAVAIYPQADDLRLVSNLIDRLPTPQDIGAELQLVWEPHPQACWLPRYRLGAVVADSTQQKDPR